ncbi:MAG: permease [Chloroflexota bacterium]|nr:permease [Chloroflexota bacterium]
MERSKRLIIALLLLFLILCPLAIEGLPPAVLFDQFQTFSTIFLGIFIEAVPFLLAGTLASGLIEVFVSRERVLRLVPRNPLVAALMGSILGFVFPVCECGVVPVTRRLFRKGLALPVGAAYLVAAPVVNPIVIASTWTAYGFGKVLLMRVGLTLAIAVTIGYVFALASDPSRVLRPEPITFPLCNVDPHPPQRWFRRLPAALVVAGDEFFEMGRYLVFGSLLAATLQTLTPQAALLGIGHGPVTSVLAMMSLAFVLSVCSTVDAFVSLAFTSTFTSGSILAFLVFGPMVDLKSLLMFLGVFRRRAVAYLVLLPLAMTLFAALFLNLNVGW